MPSFSRLIARPFIAGLLAVFPLVLTAAVIIWLVEFLYGFLGPNSFLGKGIESIGLTMVSGETLGYLIGAGLGLIAAVVLGLLLFRGALRINLRSFFTATNVLLILFAACLVAGGVHELQEAGVIPIVLEHLWDINPSVVGEGYPLLHENGLIGSIARGLFGYNGNPSMIEVAAYLVYLITVSGIWLLSRSSNAGRSPRSSGGRANRREVHA